MTKQVVGWDIGGAHLKAVLLNQHGHVLNVKQLPCPLWKGLDQLADAVDVMLRSFNLSANAVKHAITMTGELVDLFDNRVAGVKAIADMMIKTLSNDVWFYRIASPVDDCFVMNTEIDQHAKVIASANWHASAQWLASQLEAAVLMDIGSTTTDIILMEDNQVILHGLSDAERMQQGSLVYTGVVRTPVMAIAQTLAVDNQQTYVAAEYFAAMADVYRLTKELPASVDLADTADGADKSLLSSARRLARMVGYDVEDKPMHIWTALAKHCRQQQIKLLMSAVKHHIKPQMPIIGAGAGVFVVEALAKQLDQPYQPIQTILKTNVPEGATQAVLTCFPAYAVAQLAMERM